MKFMYYFSRTFAATIVAAIFIFYGRLFIGNFTYLFMIPAIIFLAWWAIND